MRAVQRDAVSGVAGQLLVTVVLALTIGLGPLGWVVGVSSGLVVNLLVARGAMSHGANGLGPADRVTLTRATLAGGVAAMVADSFFDPVSTAILMSLIVPALVLDAVDGWVARRTETVSALGARFDGEVDAFLILVLSVYVAASVGVWVLAIGLARYAFLLAGWVSPRLRRALPPRYWRKVVAAVQGVVLAVASAGVLPGRVTTVALLAALAMLTESFGHDLWWLFAARGSAREARVRHEKVGAA